MNHSDDYSRNYTSFGSKKCKKNGKMKVNKRKMLANSRKFQEKLTKSSQGRYFVQLLK